MSELREAAEQYFQLRGELGYKMHRVTRILRSFVAFAEQEGAAHVTTDLALRWAQQPSDAQPTTWAWRHRFAVRSRLGWYRAGINVEREMPKLTAYLGHTHVYVTYWYIEAVAELLELAARRLENPEASRP